MPSSRPISGVAGAIMVLDTGEMRVKKDTITMAAHFLLYALTSASVLVIKGAVDSAHHKLDQPHIRGQGDPLAPELLRLKLIVAGGVDVAAHLRVIVQLCEELLRTCVFADLPSSLCLSCSV